MNTIKSTLRNASGPVQLARHLIRYTAVFLWALLSPKAVLAARLLAAESQLAVCRDRIERHQDCVVVHFTQEGIQETLSPPLIPTFEIRGHGQMEF